MFKILVFPQNIKQTEKYKLVNKILLKILVGPDKDWPCFYVSPFAMKNQSYVVLKNYLDKDLKKIQIFGR